MKNGSRRLMRRFLSSHESFVYRHIKNGSRRLMRRFAIVSWELCISSHEERSRHLVRRFKIVSWDDTNRLMRECARETIVWPSVRRFLVRRLFPVEIDSWVDWKSSHEIWKIFPLWCRIKHICGYPRNGFNIAETMWLHQTCKSIYVYTPCLRSYFETSCSNSTTTPTNNNENKSSDDDNKTNNKTWTIRQHHHQH